MRRTSTDAGGTPRPVSFSTKFQRVHPGTTGVTVLEHLERLDAVEASLQRLGTGDTIDEEEVDVGVVAVKNSSSLPSTPVVSGSGQPTSPFSPPGSPLATVQEVADDGSSIDEQDLAAMSKSTSHVEGLSPRTLGATTPGLRGIDWVQNEDILQKRVVIAERMEIVNKQPLCSCW